MNKQETKYKISPRGKRKLDYPSKSFKPSVKLPLVGKTIFLDVKETKQLKQLKEDLKKLGATLEDFVSRDINYLITSQPRPKKKPANPCKNESPTPSPFNCDPSPSPGYQEDKIVTSVTRGKALLEKARYTRQASTLLDNAEKWGVKIVSIEGAFKWINIELKKLPKLSRHAPKKNKSKCVSSYKLFKSPFVKLEAESLCYRPFYTEIDVWPRLDVNTPRGSCPFDGTLIKGDEESREERGELLAAQVDIPSDDTPREEKECESADSTAKASIDVKKSESEAGGSRILTAGELKRRKELKKKLERKRGYCECCHVKYEDLDKHVKEEQHRQYVRTKSNYYQLDVLIQSGPNTKHLNDYLTKLANRRLDSENGVRRSPRKMVQDSACDTNSSHNLQKQSINRTPKKFHLPGEIGTTYCRQSVRVSLTKDLKVNIDNRVVNVSKTSDLHALERKHSKVEKTLKESDVKNSKENASLNKNVDKNGTGGKNKGIRQSVQVEETYNTKSPSEKALKREKACQELSKVKDSQRISSPRKQLAESCDVENKEFQGNSRANNQFNKENISPCTQKIGSPRKENSSHSREKQDRNEVRKTQNADKVNSSPRKCAEKNVTRTAKNFVGEICRESRGDSNKKAVLEKNDDDYQLIKSGFADIVKYGKKRTEVEQSSDDFEVCIARSLGETLPITKDAVEKAVEKTFDEMVELHENTNIGSVSSKTDLDDNDKISSSSKKSSSNEESDKCLKGKVSKSSVKVIVNEEIQNGKVRKEKDMFDIDMDSDISENYCYGEGGSGVLFSKSLAERIKERSHSRKASVESYNVNTLFQLPSRSRSNSFSSNNSEKVSNKEHKAKLKKGVNNILKKKTIGSIASAKVLNKYRNSKFGKVQNEITLKSNHGDDKNGKTQSHKHIKPCQKSSKAKFWYYEPIVENRKSQELNKKLSGLQKELQELEAASSWFSLNDSGPNKSRMKSSKLESPKLTSDKDSSKIKMKGERVFTSNSSQGCSQHNGIKMIESDSRDRKNDISLQTDDVPQQIHERHRRRLTKSKELEDCGHNSRDTEFSSTRRDRKSKERSKLECELRSEDSVIQENSSFPIPDNLIDSWNSGVTLDRSSRRKHRKVYIDDHSDYSDNDLSKDTSRKTKKVSLQKVNQTSNENEESNRRSSSKSKVCRFWEFIPVVHCKADEINTNIPKILRDSWNSGDSLDRHERRKNRNSEDTSSRTNEDTACRPKGKEAIKENQEDKESGAKCIEYEKVRKNDKLKNSKKISHNLAGTKKTCTSNVEKSSIGKKEGSWSKTRKMVQYEKACVNGAKGLPKELQILQDSWNDLNTVQKRSRSHQSENFDDSKAYDKSLNDSEISEQTQNSYNDMIIGEKNLSLTKSKVTYMSKKGTDKKGVSEIQNEEDSKRSKSPVFRVTKKNKFQVKRRKSPVFNRSPRQTHELKENSSRIDKKISDKHSSVYNVKEIGNKQVKGSNVRASSGLKGSIINSFNEKSFDKAEDVGLHSGSNIQSDKQETERINMTTCSGNDVKTPEKCASVKEPGSGYSSTPRAERRKNWKRKNTDSAGQQDVKKRKVENNLIDKTPKRRLLQEHSEDITNQTAKCTKNVNNQSKEKNGKDCHINADGQLPLIWKPIGSDKKENCEKVKLNKSWTLLSERSISKLLSSEDDIENFDGFTENDKLPSDMSYEEQCEVEFPKDDQHQWVVEDTDRESDVEENLGKYVPVFLPSPNKTSNSSWNDAVEGYIENSVNHGPNSSMKIGSSSFNFTLSPRRDYVRPITESGQIHSCRKLGSPERVRAVTPKSKKNVQSGDVERVDAEIEFNFGSPQKDCSDFSPLRSFNGVVRNLSVTPYKTSTPVSKKSKCRNIRNIK